MGGAQSISQEITSNLTVQLQQTVTNSVKADCDLVMTSSIIASGNSACKYDEIDINQRTNCSISSVQSALAETMTEQKLREQIQLAMEQTTQNLSLNVTSQSSDQMIKTTTDLITNLRTDITNQSSVSAYMDANVVCKDSAAAQYGKVSINQASDITQQLVQNAVTKTTSMQTLTQMLAADSKQTVKDAILGIILALALIMILFVGGPAIGGLVVAGKATGFVFDTLTKTPETKMLLVAIIFMLVLLYISADCNGSFPVYRLSVPPSFVRNLPTKIGGPRIPALFTMGIVPSFCRGSKNDKGERKLYKARMYVAYAIVVMIFAASMFRLFQETKIPTSS